LQKNIIEKFLQKKTEAGVACACLRQPAPLCLPLPAAGPRLAPPASRRKSRRAFVE